MPKTKKEIISRPDLDLFVSETNIEVSHTIIETYDGNVFTLDALVGESKWLRGIGFHCDEQVRDQVLALMMERRTQQLANRPPRNPSVILLSSNPASKSSSNDLPTPPEWIGSHEEILQRLESDQTTKDELEKAILAAEITDFSHEEVERLLVSLGRFIEQNRFATDDPTMVLLGCAIRKYALNMPSQQLEQYVDWLAMGETRAVCNRVELELVKGALWRLCYEPFEAAGDYPKTKETLKEIVDGYLNPRLIFQENNVSTAACAVTALFVLHGISSDEESISTLFGKVKELDRDWISELIEDDIAESVDAIAEHDSQLSERLSTFFENAKANLF